MKNRIVSLFELDDLLAPPTNGHAHAAHRRPVRKAARATSPPTDVAPAPTKQRTPRSGTVAQSFDTGAPIHCEHAIAYPPVVPVELPTAPSPPQPGSSQAHSLGLVVEAFEEDGSQTEEPSLQITANDAYPVTESTHRSPDAWATPERPPGPLGLTPPISAGFTAQMNAVEQDLAELAQHVQHPPPNTTPPTPPDESEAGSARQASAPKGHALFDAMAQGMNYATEFRLPPVQLSQVFSALDRQLDADERSAPAPSPAEPVVVAAPGGDVLLADLAKIATSQRPDETAAALGAAIDVRHDVQLVPQQTGYSCWAAGAAMVVGWRDRMSVDPSEIARATGYWAQYASGLNAEDTHMFAVWRLKPEAAQTYTVQGFADLLRRHGPLWVASAEPGPHVRVVTGMVGDGTPTGTLVHIHDPWEAGMTAFRLPNRGAQYTETYQRFVEKQETLGRQEIKQQGIYVAHA